VVQVLQVCNVPKAPTVIPQPGPTTYVVLNQSGGRGDGFYKMEFAQTLEEWAKDKPLSILQLDPADRAVLRIAGNFYLSNEIISVLTAYN